MPYRILRTQLSRWRLLALTLLTIVGWQAPAQQLPRLRPGDLSLDERVAYQRAIEEVYWRHRIWPKENRAPKPMLDQVMPLSVIRAKVEDYLRKSEALAVYWKRPITGAQLQAEMDRMARQSRQPQRLRELWQALGNDPYVIAECLARPALANRLIRTWYAREERYHGERKARAQAELKMFGTVAQMRLLSGEYGEREWVKGDGRPESATRDVVALSVAEWEAKVGALPAVVSELGPLAEEEEGFSVTAVLERSEERIKVARVEWKKEPFETWWRQAQAGIGLEAAGGPHRYRLPDAASGSCTDDTWTPTAAEPLSRSRHTAVWTGSEMIVWGGYNVGATNTGGRYDPATDTWVVTSTTNAPAPRAGHMAVWTGSEMIVWGGAGLGSIRFNTGGRYNPATDTWVATSTTNAPSARSQHTAVWTASEMIVWGGCDAPMPLGVCSSSTNTGGRYDPTTDTWLTTSTTNAPSARYSHTAVWTGSEMIVWGGISLTNTGGRYNPAIDTWVATSTINAPSAGFSRTAVWTGNEMIVWGGSGTNTGGRYDPATDTWVTTSTTNAPTDINDYTAVWTGSEMIVWGGTHGPGIENRGGRYDPAANTWVATSRTNAPSARSSHTAVWTGSEMIVWGGSNDLGYLFNDGGRYDPASDTWVATSPPAPSARIDHTAVWTGSEMIVWGGFNGDLFNANSIIFNTGGRYDPATDTWVATTTNNAPSARFEHTAVWTGSEMIVWGGCGGRPCPPFTNTGGRYDPASDTWVATTTTNAPSARYNHTAVWTGSEMIVWGGDPNTGGRYNPATDTWVATSTTNAPAPRAVHTAVWTGSEMIVWGGSPLTNTGGRYDPATDTWVATTTNNAPSARSGHTAVWTGSGMIVWGGVVSGSVTDNSAFVTETGSGYCALAPAALR
jgi:N-acetylneuraminic acid mutarotase